MRARRYMAVLAGGALAAAGLVGITGSPAGAGGDNFSIRYEVATPEGEGEEVTVPDGVCGAYLEAWGARGGDGAGGDNNPGVGAAGGSSAGWVPLTPGDSLEVRVGGRGIDGSNSAGSPNGGLNGGGNGAPDGVDIYGGGGGGGYSGIFDGATALIVAGGGGGGGVEYPVLDDREPGTGGAGSGMDGVDGVSGINTANEDAPGGGGGGGTTSAGGAAGTNADNSDYDGSAGSSLQGGNGGGDTGNSWGYGGGGGGGYFGGGGGADSTAASGGGGGGSGLVPAVLGSSGTGNAGQDNGVVTISWTPCDIELTIAKTVTGDDPGVSFPVTVECTATFQFDNKQGPVNPDADIQLTPEDADGEGSAVVEVKNGEEATVTISASATLDSLECTVTEEAATLPSGYSCTTPTYSPDSAVTFWEEGESVADAATVDVTNPCTLEAAAPVAAEVVPIFTG